MQAQRYHGPSKAPHARWAWLAAALLAFVAFRPFRVVVSGPSMRPSLQPGDFLLALGRVRISRGAVVVLQRPDRPGYELVKRVRGVPGDRIGERLLAADEYWVLGDDPERSTDSRTFGPARRADIRGVVVLRYWPVGGDPLSGRRRAACG